MTQRSPVTLRSRPARSCSTGEEIANAVTHGLGVALAVAGLVALVVLSAASGDAWRVTAFSIYGATFIFLYLASTLYHAIPSAPVKRVLQRVDHAAIYVFIAGSYTPIVLVTLRGAIGWTLFGIVWGIAVSGVLLECFAGPRWRRASVALYLGLGWICVFAFKHIWSSLPGEAIALLVAGGLTYSVGVAFYLWRRLPYGHAVWHLFVLGGSVCHFLMFLLYVLPESG